MKLEETKYQVLIIAIVILAAISYKLIDTSDAIARITELSQNLPLNITYYN